MQGDTPDELKPKGSVRGNPERLRRLAERLSAQGRGTGTQMIQGHIVKKSPLEQLSNAVKGGMGAYYGAKADRAETQAKEEQERRIQDYVFSQNEQGEVDPRMQQLYNIDPQLALKAKMKLGSGGLDVGGNTGVLLDRLVKEDNGINTLQDALGYLKGGAGQTAKNNANISTGRRANYETQAGKNSADLEFKPQIAESTNRAQTIGTAQGEAENLLADMEANLPNLENVVKDLSALGKTATYGLLGRAEDAIQRQLGMDVGQDAIDRKAYVSKVNNEILPLLKQTFGAAFTVAEGDSLRETLGDVNASPEEKDAVLRQFIDNKRASIETQMRRTGVAPSQNDSISLDDFLNEGL